LQRYHLIPRETGPEGGLDRMRTEILQVSRLLGRQATALGSVVQDFLGRVQAA
jgi:hypothetical protein